LHPCFCFALCGHRLANRSGISVGNSQFTDLVYADDATGSVAYCRYHLPWLPALFQRSRIYFRSACLLGKNKGTECWNRHALTDITVDGNLVDVHVESFVYLGSVRRSVSIRYQETYFSCLVCDGILVEDKAIITRPVLIADHQDTHMRLFFSPFCTQRGHGQCVQQIPELLRAFI